MAATLDSRVPLLQRAKSEATTGSITRTHKVVFTGHSTLTGKEGWPMAKPSIHLLIWIPLYLIFRVCRSHFFCEKIIIKWRTLYLKYIFFFKVNQVDSIQEMTYKCETVKPYLNWFINITQFSQYSCLALSVAMHPAHFNTIGRQFIAYSIDYYIKY